ncbi:MAG: ACP S-malonyltransferase [Eubacteriales bacterium]|nr:ACP S-malonyltransferase [Eubacteriales bacterium]
MNREWILLFGGQGSQLPGMGQDLAEAYPELSYYRGFFHKYPQYTKLFELDGAELDKTINAQVAIVLYGLSVLSILKQSKLEIGGAFGLSIGEFTALATAAVYAPEDCLDIAVARAEIMATRLTARQAAGELDGMLAVIGLDAVKIMELLETEPAISPANFNDSRQTVLAGPVKELDAFRKRVLEAGAKRAIELKVEGAFHSPVFAPDVANLAAVLKQFEAHPPALKLPLNISGKFLEIPPSTEARIYLADIMSQQMSSPTHAAQALDNLIEVGFRNFLEISPKPVLLPLLRRRSRELELAEIRDLNSLENFIARMENNNE